MSVPVRVADRDEGERTSQPLIQRFALVGGSVVSELHDVDFPNPVQFQHAVLRFFTKVSEEDGAHPVSFEFDRDASRVPGQSGPTTRRCGRPQDAPAKSAESADHPGSSRDDSHAGRAESLQGLLVAVTRRLSDDRG